MVIMFYICYKSMKEHTIWIDNSVLRVLNTFQCTFSAAIYCICDLYLILIYGHDDSLKIIEWNATNSPYAFNHYTKWYYRYMCYLLSNVLLFNAVISLDYWLPKGLREMRLVDCNFLKPNYISHITMWLAFQRIRRYPAIAKSLRYPKIIGIPIVLISSCFSYMYLRINIIF